MTTLLQRLEEQPDIAAVIYAETFPGASERCPSGETELEERVAAQLDRQIL